MFACLIELLLHLSLPGIVHGTNDLRTMVVPLSHGSPNPASVLTLPAALQPDGDLRGRTPKPNSPTAVRLRGAGCAETDREDTCADDARTSRFPPLGAIALRRWLRRRPIWFPQFEFLELSRSGSRQRGSKFNPLWRFEARK